MAFIGGAAAVAVVATGGTIASRRRPDGSSIPSVPVTEMPLLRDRSSALRVRDIMAKDSASLTLADMETIRIAVAEELSVPDTAGVVVLHGTDALEETAFLLDLQHNDPRPVVVTGAQRTADHPEPDGPSNLRAALAAAVDPASYGRGVLVVFGERVLPARGLYKQHTTSLDAFRSSAFRNPRRKLVKWDSIAETRVDVVAVYPGSDGAHIEASLAAGARGIVLAALGAGNANAAVVESVRLCSARKVPVVVSTRVPEGSLAATYGGGGGGHDLLRAGALLSETLRPSQARILLAALLAANTDLQTIAEAFTDCVSFQEISERSTIS